MFTTKTLDFLFENRVNNSKEWFDDHRFSYNEFVVKPLAGLVEELTPTMLKIDSSFIVEPKIDRTISRIRRDTRFSHDKSIYRDVQWISFMRNKKLYFGYPGFFLSCLRRASAMVAAIIAQVRILWRASAHSF